MRKAAERFGRTPNALKERPELTDAAEFYTELFQTLFSGYPIPSDDIRAVCEWRGITDVEKTAVIIWELQRTIFQHQSEQLKNDGAARRRNQQSGGESRGA